MNMRPAFHPEPVIFTVDWRAPLPRRLTGWRAPVRVSLNRSAPGWMLVLFGICVGLGMAFLTLDGPAMDGPEGAHLGLVFLLGGMTGVLMSALGAAILLTWRLRARLNPEQGDRTTVRLSAAGIETLGDLMDTRMSWRLLERIEDRDEGLVLVLKNGAMAPVPLNALPADVDAAELRRRVRRWRLMAEGR